MKNLTKEEATFLIHAFNGVGASLGTVVGNIHTAIPHTDSRGCNPIKLAQKIERWTDKERAELLDRIDQFWDEGAIADVGDRLKEVGLIH
jgi:hypothetical protein